MKAVVVFHNHGGHAFDRWLKLGFRHVFCALASDEFWVRIDAQAGCPVIEVVAPTNYDLATFYRAEGFTVIETEQRTIPLRWPLMVVNCVGLVKMVLCIKAPLAVTPWGLYRLLSRGALLPGASNFLPGKPLGKRLANLPGNLPGTLGVLQKFGRGDIKGLTGVGPSGSEQAAAPATAAAATPAASGITPLQRKPRKGGRRAILAGEDESAALLGRPTARLGS